MTDAERDALQASTLDTSTPLVIRGVSHSQFSVARHYGGCMFQGQQYVYQPETDELIRADVVKWLAKHRTALKIKGRSLDGQ